MNGEAHWLATKMQKQEGENKPSRGCRKSLHTFLIRKSCP